MIDSISHMLVYVILSVITFLVTIKIALDVGYAHGGPSDDVILIMFTGAALVGSLLAVGF